MTTCAAARRVALVRALDDRAQAAAPVGVFELGVEAARAEIHFGGDPRCAQGRDEPLVVGHVVAVEHERRRPVRASRRRRRSDCRSPAAPPAGAKCRSRSRSPEPARRESAPPARRSARRRRPSRSGSACRPRRASRRSARPRRRGRCNIRGRGRRRGRSGCDLRVASRARLSSAIVAKLLQTLMRRSDRVRTFARARSSRARFVQRSRQSSNRLRTRARRYVEYPRNRITIVRLVVDQPAPWVKSPLSSCRPS